ncbi:MAG: MerR family transcriptional regulator [Proteobacteria bacterium]|nr:MerR family transcriptional regulator [Pseudomonadota bacterium]
MKPNVFQETAAAVAKRFGVSVKALRVYEELGLLKPARTVSSWRIYRQPELERLSAILALKQLGLPLKRIGELLRGGGDLGAALAMQEAALVEAKAEAEQALELVRAARAKIADRKRLSPDELSNLVRSTAMSEFKWNERMEALANKHFTADQLQRLRARPFTAADQERVGATWNQIFADIAALGPDPDPASDSALDIARRADALLAEFSGGDPTMLQAAGKMNTEAFNDPELAPRMPGQVQYFIFVNKAIAELRKRGEAVVCGGGDPH